MFYDGKEQLNHLVRSAGCVVIVLPPGEKLDLPYALTLGPDEDKKTVMISTESVRNFLSLATCRETKDRFYVIDPADALKDDAQSALLKTLEEPHDHVHFILVVSDPGLLLPTIRSRAQIYFPKITNRLAAAPVFKPKVMEMAKRLISARRGDLPALAKEIAKKQNQPRQYALDVTSAAIEILYKSYAKTKNHAFLAKLPGFLALHRALKMNCNIKLQIVACLAGGRASAPAGGVV